MTYPTRQNKKCGGQPKLQYGLQQCSKVRLQEEEEIRYNMKMTQQSQNKVFKVLDGSRIADKRSIKKMLDRCTIILFFSIIKSSNLFGKIKKGTIKSDIGYKALAT